MPLYWEPPALSDAPLPGSVFRQWEVIEPNSPTRQAAKNVGKAKFDLLVPVGNLGQGSARSPGLLREQIAVLDGQPEKISLEVHCASLPTGASLSSPKVHSRVYLEDMDIYEARRLALISLLNGPRFNGGKAALADEAKVPRSYLTRMLKAEGEPDKKRIGEDMAAKIERELRLQTGELLHPVIARANPIITTDDPDSVAHALSHRQPIMDIQEIEWERLSVTKLEGMFAMEIRGEALAPRFLPGQCAIWQAGDSAQDGQPVLIELEGSFFLRFYEGRGATWAGVADRTGHRELQPEQGAKIVARLRYLDLG